MMKQALAGLLLTAAAAGLAGEAAAKERGPRFVTTIRMDGKTYIVRHGGKWAYAVQRSIVVTGDRKYWKALERAAEIATGCGSKGLTRSGSQLDYLVDCSIKPEPAGPDVVVKVEPRD